MDVSQLVILSAFPIFALTWPCILLGQYLRCAAEKRGKICLLLILCSPSCLLNLAVFVLGVSQQESEERRFRIEILLRCSSTCLIVLIDDDVPLPGPTPLSTREESRCFIRIQQAHSANNDVGQKCFKQTSHAEGRAGQSRVGQASIRRRCFRKESDVATSPGDAFQTSSSPDHGGTNEPRKDQCG